MSVWTQPSKLIAEMCMVERVVFARSSSMLCHQKYAADHGQSFNASMFAICDQ